jgi:predicted nucleotidyltransferase
MTQAATIDDQIRGVFKDFPKVKLVILFGSVATSSAHTQSDLDVAVLARQPLMVEEKMRIIEALALEIGRPVDLIDLFATPEPITGQVIKHGRLVLGGNSEFAELLSRHLVEMVDFVPIQERIFSERRAAWIGK